MSLLDVSSTVDGSQKGASISPAQEKAKEGKEGIFSVLVSLLIPRPREGVCQEPGPQLLEPQEDKRPVKSPKDNRELDRWWGADNGQPHDSPAGLVPNPLKGMLAPPQAQGNQTVNLESNPGWACRSSKLALDLELCDLGQGVMDTHPKGMWKSLEENELKESHPGGGWKKALWAPPPIKGTACSEIQKKQGSDSIGGGFSLSPGDGMQWRLGGGIGSTPSEVSSFICSGFRVQGFGDGNRLQKESLVGADTILVGSTRETFFGRYTGEVQGQSVRKPGLGEEIIYSIDAWVLPGGAMGKEDGKPWTYGLLDRGDLGFLNDYTVNGDNSALRPTEETTQEDLGIWFQTRAAPWEGELPLAKWVESRSVTGAVLGSARDLWRLKKGPSNIYVEWHGPQRDPSTGDKEADLVAQEAGFDASGDLKGLTGEKEDPLGAHLQILGTKEAASKSQRMERNHKGELGVGRDTPDEDSLSSHPLQGGPHKIERESSPLGTDTGGRCGGIPQKTELNKTPGGAHVVHLVVKDGPEDPLRIRLRIQNETLDALFMTHSVEQKANLESQLGQLRQELINSGLLPHLTVELGGGGGTYGSDKELPKQPEPSVRAKCALGEQSGNPGEGAQESHLINIRA